MDNYGDDCDKGRYNTLYCKDYLDKKCPRNCKFVKNSELEDAVDLITDLLKPKLWKMKKITILANILVAIGFYFCPSNLEGMKKIPRREKDVKPEYFLFNKHRARTWWQVHAKHGIENVKVNYFMPGRDIKRPFMFEIYNVHNSEINKFPFVYWFDRNLNGKIDSNEIYHDEEQDGFNGNENLEGKIGTFK